MQDYVQASEMSTSVAPVDTRPRQAVPGFSDAQLLGAVVDTSEDAIIAKSASGLIVSWNASAERLFGYPAREALGRHISIIVPPERLSEEEEIMSRLLRGERIRRFETVRQRKNGDRLTVELSITPVKDPGGRVIGAVKVARDLREHLGTLAALREEEERFRVLADNISQLAWMADSRGLVFWYNKRWFEYTGVTLAESQGCGWSRLVHPDHEQRVTASLQHSWATGAPWEDEFPLRGRDGEFRWFLSHALPIRDADGRIVRWFGTSTDITAQRHLAEELRALSDELAQANRRKDEFLAALSHEIRNPLGAIRAGVTVMRSGQLDVEAETRTQAMVERQVAHLARLLDDLLDVSRTVHGRLIVNLADIPDVRSVVEDAVAAVLPLLRAADVTLTRSMPDRPVPVRGDSARLQQILVNVLSNAARYTLPGGRADLRVWTEGTDLVATITDTGVGIRSDLLPQIFELFAQCQPDTAAATSGLGIGLYLTRELATRHHGSISAASDGPGQGSTFTIRLPIVSEPLDATAEIAEPLERQLPAGAANAPRRVLVVDDDPDNAEGLAMLIRIAGHEAEIAHDGPTAIAAARTFLPDVVLLDLGLPGMDGIETCRRLRSIDGPGPRPFVIAVTGWGQPADYQRTRAAGFDHHLVKPVEPQQLLALLSPLEQQGTT